jgi:hypothetical protein
MHLLEPATDSTNTRARLKTSRNWRGQEKRGKGIVEARPHKIGDTRPRHLANITSPRAGWHNPVEKISIMLPTQKDFLLPESDLPLFVRMPSFVHDAQDQSITHGIWQVCQRRFSFQTSRVGTCLDRIFNVQNIVADNVTRECLAFSVPSHFLLTIPRAYLFSRSLDCQALNFHRQIQQWFWSFTRCCCCCCFSFVHT